MEQILAVADAPVIFSDKFQQSKSCMFFKAPQIQFIDRVRTFRCANGDAKTVEIPQVQLLDNVVVLPVSVQTVQKTVEFLQVLYLDKVDTPVVVQGQVSSCRS